MPPLADVADRLPQPVAQAWTLARRTATCSVHDRIHGLAAEAAFFAILSLPPMLIAVIGSIGYIASLLGPEATAQVASVVIGVPETFLAPDTMATVRPMLESVLRDGRAGIASFGFLLAIWGGSRAVNVYLETLALAYNVEDPRPTWKRRALAYALTVGGAAIGALVIPPLVMGPDLISLVVPPTFDAAAEAAARLAFWPAVISLTVVMLTSLYHLGVPWHTPFWRDLPGAAVAVVLWVVGGAAVRLYADVSLRREDDIYGPLATPLVVLLWLYLISFAVLLGAELNAEIERMWPHGDVPLRERMKERLRLGSRHRDDHGDAIPEGAPAAHSRGS